MDAYQTALLGLGKRARALRQARELQQAELAARAGIGAGTVTRFESTGRASLENVLRIAAVLGADEAFERLFALPEYRTLDEALRSGPAERQRVRRRK